MNKFSTLLVALFAVVAINSYAHNTEDETQFNCYTVAVGKAASADGTIILGHNEDDWNEQMLSMYIVPSNRYEKGDMLSIEGNASIPQPSRTSRYFWIEMMAQHYADVYLNDHGVAIVSNKCSSREDREDYTEGGLSYTLRRALAERAKSAKGAMELIGELVEKYGYSSTGRTYTVADKKEIWVVSVVQGRHWIAQRVADDQVMIIPNYYTIDKIDLNDTANFRGSKDIVEYAISRGWYNPSTDGEFSFRKAYSDIPTLNSENNKGRKWGGLRFLTKEQYNINDEFPFQFVPKQKVDIQQVMRILSDHFEGTEMDRVAGLAQGGDPHTEKGTICNLGTQSSSVFNLRDLPTQVGAIMWLSMYSPCRQVYVPWYFGVDRLSSDMGAYTDANRAADSHYTVKKGFRETFPRNNYWTYVDYSKRVGENYVENMKQIRPKLDKLQKEIFAAQKHFDKQIQEEYMFLKVKGGGSSEDIVAKKLGDFSRKYYQKMLKFARSEK